MKIEDIDEAIEIFQELEEAKDKERPNIVYSRAWCWKDDIEVTASLALGSFDLQDRVYLSDIIEDVFEDGYMRKDRDGFMLVSNEWISGLRAMIKLIEEKQDALRNESNS
jgi:hypothetical protein